MSKNKKEFNSKSKLPYEVTLQVGDYSSDGHGICTEITFKSSHPVEELQKAYLKSVKKTGLSFDHGKHSKGKIQICTEYEDRHIPDEAKDKMIKLGYDIDSLDDPEWLEPKDLGNMVLWFIGLNLKDFKHETIVPRKTYFNGGNNLNVQIGYGVTSPS
jgi:hypothetical protein